jgi:hypothetical protein
VAGAPYAGPALAGEEGGVSQPRHEASWTPAHPDPSWAQPDPAGADDDPAADWAGLTGPAPGRTAEDPADRGGRADRAAGRAAGHRRGPRLTGRGAIAGMLLVFFVGVLVADWLHWGVLAGLSFVAGSAAAAWYTKQRDLLTVAVSPPLLFFIVVICVKALTAAGNELLSTVEGTALTLANVAPWLFTGVVLSLLVAWFRGLPRCAAELRRDLRPELARRRPTGPSDPDSTATVGGYQPAVKRSR